MTRDRLPAALLFDLDGTLIDSAPDIRASANVIADALGVERFDLATITRFIGHGIPMLVERILDARGLDPRLFGRAYDLFLDHYAAHATDLTRPFDRVPDVLEELRAAGLQLAVVTNKPQEPAVGILADLGLDHLFDAVVGGDSAAAKKPDPAAYLFACEQIGIPAHESAYVGDSETDAATALNAGVPFLLFLSGYRRQPPDAFETPYRFERFDELPGLLRQMWKVERALPVC